MSDSGNVAQTGIIKRLESLIALALARSSGGALLALQNTVNTNDSLADLAGPSSSILIAAIEATPRASGLFVVNINYVATDSAADSVQISVKVAPGPVTAFTGGTLEQAGGGSPPKPAVRYVKNGLITASAGSPVLVAQQLETTTGAGGIGLNVTASCQLPTGQPQAAGLILIELDATHDLSLQNLVISAFELPNP